MIATARVVELEPGEEEHLAMGTMVIAEDAAGGVDEQDIINALWDNNIWGLIDHIPFLEPHIQETDDEHGPRYLVQYRKIHDSMNKVRANRLNIINIDQIYQELGRNRGDILVKYLSNRVVYDLQKTRNRYRKFRNDITKRLRRLSARDMLAIGFDDHIVKIPEGYSKTASTAVLNVSHIRRIVPLLLSVYGNTEKLTPIIGSSNSNKLLSYVMGMIKREKDSKGCVIC